MSSATEVKLAMRKLWEDHITYTRNYIISDIAGITDTEAVSKRLMQNQEEIGDAIKPYYGAEAGDRLTKLLKDHIVIATKVVKEAKGEDTKALSAAQDEWKKNADDIASFLSGANPDNWPQNDMQDMLHKHLDLTTDEVTSRLKKNWDADIKAYDKGHEHMLKFADVLTDGIARQFPSKFSGLTGGNSPG